MNTKKNHHKITLRVYDGGKNFGIDRYTLYVPTPRNLVKEWRCAGNGLGFSWSDNTINRCCWFECENGLYGCNLGRKVRRDNLPAHVQKWISEMETLYNNAINLDTQKAWDKWNVA